MAVEYEQGMTKAWSDGEKIVISNPNSTQHLEDNVDRMFGVGEYQKIFDVHYTYDIETPKKNAMARSVTLISGYIPQRVLDDLLDMKSSGLSAKDLMSKYE